MTSRDTFPNHKLQALGGKINSHKQKGAPEVSINNYNETREHFYYWICHKFNTTEYNTTLNAAYFIFLNKTGFRGMFRENKEGDYIITSNIKGHGKGIDPQHIYSKQLFGKIIAQAIEDGDGESYTIKAMIRKM